MIMRYVGEFIRRLIATFHKLCASSPRKWLISLLIWRDQIRATSWFNPTSKSLSVGIIAMDMPASLRDDIASDA
jgi:hypothetical protein